MRCLKLVVLVMLALGVNSPAIAQNKTKSNKRNASLVKFDWNCSSISAYPKKRLDQIVLSTINQQSAGGRTQGDRAVALDLNGDHKSEYFVPLVCGATGNCEWGLFAFGPLRLMGTINAEYIYVRTRDGQWPKLITYGHLSVVEGILTTYDIRKGRYVQSSKTLPVNHGEFALEIQGGMGHKMPKFLKAANPLCESIGW